MFCMKTIHFQEIQDFNIVTREFWRNISLYCDNIEDMEAETQSEQQLSITGVYFEFTSRSTVFI